MTPEERRTEEHRIVATLRELDRRIKLERYGRLYPLITIGGWAAATGTVVIVLGHADWQTTIWEYRRGYWSGLFETLLGAAIPGAFAYGIGAGTTGALLKRLNRH